MRQLFFAFQGNTTRLRMTDIIWGVIALIVVIGLIVFQLPWPRDQKLSALVGIAVIFLALNSVWYDRNNLKLQRMYQQLEVASEVGGADRGALIAQAIAAQTQTGAANPGWFLMVQPWIEEPAFIAFWDRYQHLFSRDTQRTVALLRDLSFLRPPSLQGTMSSRQ